MSRKLSGFGAKRARANPPKPKSALASYPALDFALSNHMITDDERDACIKGNMEVRGHQLYNWNYDHPTILTGDSVKLYPGRKWEVLADRLLGLEGQDE